MRILAEVLKINIGYLQQVDNEYNKARSLFDFVTLQTAALPCNMEIYSSQKDYLGRICMEQHNTLTDLAIESAFAAMCYLLESSIYISELSH